MAQMALMRTAAATQVSHEPCITWTGAGSPASCWTDAGCWGRAAALPPLSWMSSPAPAAEPKLAAGAAPAACCREMRRSCWPAHRLDASRVQAGGATASGWGRSGGGTRCGTARASRRGRAPSAAAAAGAASAESPAGCCGCRWCCGMDVPARMMDLSALFAALFITSAEHRVLQTAPRRAALLVLAGLQEPRG